MFLGAYKGKRVLVTGHTGFKGSWLSLWLLRLGAEVAGFSLFLPSDPCNFEALKLENKIRHYEGDVRNIDEIKKVMEEFKPEIVFHLAAQSLVRRSYDQPKDTFDTNLGGTVNILEGIRNCPSVRAAVIITSDKCYRNVEQDLGYHEDDTLGGDDPYSASKGCAELAVRSYAVSYFNKDDSPKVSTTRAGNVIGGGDWAQDRIIPDCVRAWSRKKESIIRNPEATRPWQHVLEPLSGYLWLGANLIKNPEKVTGEAFNFGPDEKVVQPVKELVDQFLRSWPEGQWKHMPSSGGKKESSLLSLSCDKALKILGWQPVLDFDETVNLTAEWYKTYYDGGNIYDFSCTQIDSYVEKGFGKNASWTKKGA
ncbi:MAG: CDP-glucose 4,6-dehydratase [Candidatus Omnitrophica bacterium]|nr:CDP-glucose 4,6-dehydratase [Candidatus Omnitrophota bacterium]